jgi:hypothetical protein
VLTPVAMPEILLGVSLLLFFRQVLDLTLGLVSILIAHITFSIGFVAIVVRVRLAMLDESIFEAARDLGASPWQTFRRVTLPLILPAMLAGFLMSFTLSIDDFVITFFVAGVGVTTLPLQIYSMIKVAVTSRSECRFDAADGADADADCAGREAAPDTLKGRMHEEPVARRPPAGAAAAWRLATPAHAEDVLYLYIWNSYLSEDTVSRFEAQCQLPLNQDYLLRQRGDAGQARSRRHRLRSDRSHRLCRRDATPQGGAASARQEPGCRTSPTSRPSFATPGTIQACATPCLTRRR